MVDRHLRVTGRAGAVTEGQARVRRPGREAGRETGKHAGRESDRKAGCIAARFGMPAGCVDCVLWVMG